MYTSSYYNLGQYFPNVVQQSVYANTYEAFPDKPTLIDNRDIPGVSRSWNISDVNLPEANIFDEYDEWIDGSVKMVFRIKDEKLVKCLKSGWSMRNSNNHNVEILKKSCVGVFSCTLCKVIVSVPVSETCRKAQSDCPKKNCRGKLLHIPCAGKNGHPVTHCWRRVGRSLYLDAKGTHDHPKPTMKASRMRTRRPNSRNQTVITVEPPIPISNGSSSTCSPTNRTSLLSVPQVNTDQSNYVLPHAPGFSGETSVSSSASSFYQSHPAASFYPQDYPMECQQFPPRMSEPIKNEAPIISELPQRYSQSSAPHDPGYFNYVGGQPSFNLSYFPQNADFVDYNSMSYPGVVDNPTMSLQQPNIKCEYFQWSNCYSTD